ncbi:NAD(P)/FAD-dependent oxidoreductase [Demetria terragena]|uniref:NAD(P)/FAD-dependent oxidoreductase n=1 Tax=Demetria terragena TaxID=63959 RepID=UPI00058C2C68|nr:FAD/NAD(P)-binding oxidoreductase [Demetria terragena]
MTQVDVVVVGASLAGVTTARALSELDSSLDIVVVGDEPHLPYDRPPLSKSFLQLGDIPPLPDPLVADQEPLGVYWRLGVRAESLSTEDGPCVTLSDGEELHAPSVVIATGATARRLPGSGLLGVYVLRTLDDAHALRAGFESARRVVVVGAGFIGAEVASAARERGLEVTVVEATSSPLANVLGASVAERCVGEHEKHGTRLLRGVGVAGFVGHQRVSGVRLDTGEVLPADVVIIGVGAKPEVRWLRDSGIPIDQGVLVDEQGKTSVPGVWAAGDCTQTWDDGLGEYVRSEHWTHAIVQGRAVARSVVGLEPQAGQVPYFWSHQYDTWIQMAGHVAPTDEIRVLDGDLAEGPVLVAYERAGDVVGVLAIDKPKQFTRARKALDRGLPLW